MTVLLTIIVKMVSHTTLFCHSPKWPFGGRWIFISLYTQSMEKNYFPGSPRAMKNQFLSSTQTIIIVFMILHRPRKKCFRCSTQIIRNNFLSSAHAAKKLSWLYTGHGKLSSMLYTGYEKLLSELYRSHEKLLP